MGLLRGLADGCDDSYFRKRVDLLAGTLTPLFS
jgi:hypothetical protein